MDTTHRPSFNQNHVSNADHWMYAQVFHCSMLVQYKYGPSYSDRTNEEYRPSRGDL